MTPELPGYVAAVIVAVDLAMAALVFVGVRRLAATPGVLAANPASPAPAPERVARLTRFMAALLVGWAAAALLVTFAPLPPTAVGVIAYVVVVAGAGYALVTRTGTGRRLFAAVPQTWLIGAQVYRVVGGIFLIAAARDVVPTYFAVPAAWGDIATGLGAVLVARWWAAGRPLVRPAAVAWNLFGLLDLVVAIGIGSSLLAAPAAALFGGSPAWVERGAAGFQMDAAIFPVEFPLALIPTFAVPLGVTLHLLSLHKLWSERTRPPPRERSTLAAETAASRRPA